MTNFERLLTILLTKNTGCVVENVFYDKENNMVNVKYSHIDRVFSGKLSEMETLVNDADNTKFINSAYADMLAEQHGYDTKDKKDKDFLFALLFV